MSDYCDVTIEMYSAVEKTCRKPRRCCECRAPIEKGERYLLCSGKWEGEFGSFSQHLLCAEACMFIRDNMQGGECIAFGELNIWIAESFISRSSPQDRKLLTMVAKIERRARAAIRAKRKAASP